MDIAGIGWRDLVLIAAALVGVYLVFTLARLFQVAGRRRAAVPPAPTLEDDDAFDGPLTYDEPRLPFADAAPATGATGATGATPAPSFAKELGRSTLEGELHRLRRESEQLREQVAHLTEEVSRLKSARNVSPLYGEAMSLAQQGLPPESIAGHCGISLGEAELVAALARSEDEFDREQYPDEREERDDRYPDPGNRRAHG